jgi:alcohol oxidase
MSVFTAYPYSRGKIHITSRSDVLNGYEFDTGFLSHQSDLKKQLWGYKVSREIFRRMPFYKGEVELGHPKFRARSKAALVTAGDLQTGTPNLEVANIQYDEQDDTAIENWIRANLKSTWHSMGTCAMRPRKEGKGGVVDGDLNVYGTVGLKVVDMSIAPQNVGANTYNTALAIGENAALIIGRELGLEV